MLVHDPIKVTIAKLRMIFIISISIVRSQLRCRAQAGPEAANGY